MGLWKKNLRENIIFEQIKKQVFKEEVVIDDVSALVINEKASDDESDRTNKCQQQLLARKKNCSVYELSPSNKPKTKFP